MSANFKNRTAGQPSRLTTPQFGFKRQCRTLRCESWKRTGTSSAVKCTSVSTDETPRSKAASKEGNVFSDLSPLAPRWPCRSKVGGAMVKLQQVHASLPCIMEATITVVNHEPANV